MKLKNSQFYDILFKFGIFAFVVNLFWVTLKRQAKNVERVNHGEGRWKAGQNIPWKTHCLKITQTVPFELFKFWHFPPIFVLLKLTCLVTLFDRKL